MPARYALFAQLAVLLLLLPVVFYGIAHSYLWDTFWYSGLAHLLGGLWAGAVAIWFAHWRGFRGNFISCVMAALVLGIGWEVFELIIGGTHFPADTIDTAEDLIMDVVGGAVAGFIARQRT